MASPLFDLTGKVAVVTGSSKGIGKSIALHLALQGARVVVSSRKKPACDEAAAEIRKAGGEAIVIPCNISDKAQCQNLIAETRKQLGPVDVLVCNAATNPYYGPTDKMPDDAFTKIMQNNILSNIWLINLCVPDMRAKKDGSVIIVSSIGGLRGSPVLGAYCVSKAADLQMARNLAVEYGPGNVRVNCIAPGTVQSPFVEGYLQKYHAHEIDKMRVELAARQPMGRLGTPEEIAAMVHYICSPEADFMTGSVVNIDGGWTAA